MFTILNFLNYYTSKFFSVNVLIILTIAIYSFIIYQYLDCIYENTTLLITSVIFMIIDLISIILIYTYSFNNKNSKKINISNSNELKENKKDSKNIKIGKDKKNSKKNNKKDNKNNTINNCLNDKINIDDDKISLYKSNMDCSINTYL